MFYYLTARQKRRALYAIDCVCRCHATQSKPVSCLKSCIAYSRRQRVEEMLAEHAQRPQILLFADMQGIETALEVVDESGLRMVCQIEAQMKYERDKYLAQHSYLSGRVPLKPEAHWSNSRAQTKSRKMNLLDECNGQFKAKECKDLLAKLRALYALYSRVAYRVQRENAYTFNYFIQDQGWINRRHGDCMNVLLRAPLVRALAIQENLLEVVIDYCVGIIGACFHCQREVYSREKLNVYICDNCWCQFSAEILRENLVGDFCAKCKKQCWEYSYTFKHLSLELHAKQQRESQEARDILEVLGV